jgi:hypothetical protein
MIGRFPIWTQMTLGVNIRSTTVPVTKTYSYDFLSHPPRGAMTPAIDEESSLLSL